MKETIEEITPEMMEIKISPIKQKGIKKTALQEESHNIQNVEIQDLIPGLYNGVTINIKDGYHCLEIPKGMDRLKFKAWRLSPAGMLSRDVIRRIKGIETGEWVLIKSKNYKTLVRLIKESEIIEFNSLYLLHGKIKDSYYMHLKTLDKDKNIRWSIGYIEEIVKTDLYELKNEELSGKIPTGKLDKSEDEENQKSNTETLF